MGFFDRLRNGFEITKISIDIAMKEPWMIILPFISAGIMIAIIIWYIITIFGITIFGGNTAQTSIAIDAFSFIMPIIIYFVGYFLTYFTQAMIIYGAKERLSGNDPTIAQAFAGASEHLLQIIILSIIGAIIGMITKILSYKKNGQKNIFMTLSTSIIGIAWTVASYFALPIIISEKKNVFDAFKRSGEITFQVWGEGISANFSLFLLYIPATILFIGSLVFLFININIIALALLILAVISFFAAIFISMPVKAIISQALYDYATKKQAPPGFDSTYLQNAFTKKDD